MKKIIEKVWTLSRKKKLIIIWGIVLIIAGGRWMFQHFFSDSSVWDGDAYLSNDMEVMSGDIVNSLNMDWRAKFSSTQKLTFPNSGRITAVFKKVGDLVEEWEIIAQMDTFEIDSELEQAKIALQNEYDALEKAGDPTKRELEILTADKKYQALLYEQKNADILLKLAIQAIENEYVNKKNDYAQLVSDYEKKQKEYDSALKTYQEIVSLDKWNAILNSDEILKEKVVDLRYVADEIIKELDKLDKVMGYSSKYYYSKSPDEIYIWARDQSTKNLVEKLFLEVLDQTTEIFDWANKIQISSFSEVQLKSTLIQQYEKIKELADKKTELSIAVDKMFEASVDTEGSTRSSITISNGRTLKTEANTTIDEILGLKTPETIWDKRKQELTDLKIALDKQKQEMDKLKIEYDQLDTDKLKKTSDAKLDYQMKDLEVKIAKIELDDLKKGDNEQVKLIQNNIKQQKNQIETIMKKYDAYTLKANFDGVITKINMQRWDTIGEWNSSSTDNEKSVYIENPDNLEIQLSIDQSDITKLVVGMPVQITLDALPDSMYTWTLVEIDTTAGDEQPYDGGTSYKAKIVFTKKAEDIILWAMTARVTIVLDEIHDVLVVPNIAISSTFDGIFVMKVENGKYKKVAIEIWMSDQANTEIISWLSLWDIIMGVFIDKEGMDAAGLGDDQWEAGDGGEPMIME